MPYGKLMRHILERRPRRVCVEAGHIYLNETPGDLHDYSAELGVEVCRQLECNGLEVAKILFVDDFNVNSGAATLNLEAYIDRISALGFRPDMVFMESAMCGHVHRILGQLQGNTRQDNGTLCLCSPKEVHLLKGDRPTCALLDAALYLEKFSQFDFCVTVLSDFWASQQSNVRHVLHALGRESAPIANVFFSEREKFKIKLPKNGR